MVILFVGGLPSPFSFREFHVYIDRGGSNSPLLIYQTTKLMSGFAVPPEEEEGSMNFLSGEDLSSLSLGAEEATTPLKAITLDAMKSWAAKFNTMLKKESGDDAALVKEEHLISMMKGDSALSLEEFICIFLRCASGRLAPSQEMMKGDGNWSMLLVNTFPKVDQIGRDSVQYIGRRLHVVGTEEILGNQIFDAIVDGSFEMPEEQQIPEEEFDEEEEEM